MFSFKSWIGIQARVLLIAVIVLNALVPTAASALAAPEPAEEERTSVPIPQGVKGATGYLSSSPRSSIVFQEGTPTEAPTEVNTETPTPEPSLTPVDTVEGTPMPPRWQWDGITPARG